MINNLNLMNNQNIDVKFKLNHLNLNQYPEIPESKSKILIDFDPDSSLIGKAYFAKDKIDQEKNNNSRLSFANEGDFIGKVEDNRINTGINAKQDKSYNNLQFKSSSGAAYNTIKALQEYSKRINLEKEEYKTRVSELHDFLEKEKENFNIKLSKELSRINELEKHLRYEISILREENCNLSKNYQKLNSEYSILKTSYSIIDKEKSRHLEQNAIDKEEFSIKLKHFSKENQELKSQICKLKEFIELKLDESELEKNNILIVQEENMNLKKDFQKKINTCIFDLNDLKSNFELEKEDLLNQISGLKEVVFSLEKQKKEIIREYEKRLSQIKSEIIKVQENTIKRSILKERENYHSLKKTKKGSESNFNKSINKSTANNIFRSASSTKSSLPMNKKTKNNNDINNYVNDEHLNKTINSQFNTIKRNINNNLNNLNSLSMSTSETFNNIKLKQINETIIKYEKNIEELQRNYDQLVEKLNLNLSLNEYEAINNDINVILTNINDNKDKLTEFKNLHKEKILNINS